MKNPGINLKWIGLYLVLLGMLGLLVWQSRLTLSPAQHKGAELLILLVMFGYVYRWVDSHTVAFLDLPNDLRPRPEPAAPAEALSVESTTEQFGGSDLKIGEDHLAVFTPVLRGKSQSWIISQN